MGYLYRLAGKAILPTGKGGQEALSWPSQHVDYLWGKREILRTYLGTVWRWRLVAGTESWESATEVARGCDLYLWFHWRDPHW